MANISIASIGGPDSIVSAASGDNIVTGVAHPGSPVTILQGTRTLGTAIPNASGVFSYALTAANIAALGQGADTITARQTVTSAGFPITVNTTAPPPPPASGTIPLSFNDARFQGMTELTAAIQVPSGQSRSNLSIVDSSGLPAITALGAITLSNCRIRAREGYRAVSGVQNLSGLYIEAFGTGSDHADGLQVYSPGSTGTITLRDSALICDGTSGTPNAAYFSANDWRGAHVLENVFLSGGGYVLRIHGDGGSSMDLKDVFIENNSWGYGPVSFPDVNGRRPSIVRWENVRLCTIVNGAIVPGALIPRPY